MEQTEREMPQKYMLEILRWFNKLKEGGKASANITLDTTSKVVEDQLVITYTLKAGNVIIAQDSIVDPRPLADIKVAAEAERDRIDAQALELKSQVEEVITLTSKK